MRVGLFRTLLCWMGLAMSANAAICNASATQGSIQTCVTNATSGDTVIVAAGTCAAACNITSTKAIHLQGAGIGSTIISGSFTYSPTTTEAVKVFEVDGFTFSGTGKHFIASRPDSTHPITGLKIHNNRYTGTTSAAAHAIELMGLEFGVFYLNTFDNNYVAVYAGTDISGDFFTATFGSANYAYFEDNTFGDGNGAAFVTETGQGGRIVLRHNTVNGYNSGGGSEFFDIHGEQGSGGWTTSTEIYHNTITNTGVGPFRFINHRGGQAIIANNTVDKALDFNFTELLGNGGFVCGIAYPVSFNASETSCSPANGTTCRVAQVNNSFYFNNILSGSNQNPIFADTGAFCSPAVHESDYIQLNRDYWLPTSGLQSALPATCTANNNTYYGATDTDRIYKCTGTNTWTVFFDPYPYPHTLRASNTNSMSVQGVLIQGGVSIK